MRTFRDAKLMAKALRAEALARKQIDLSHSECLEIVARQFGFDDWNILAAKIEQSAKSRIVRAEVDGPEVTDPRRATSTTIPILRIFSEAKALEFYLEFLGFDLDFGGPSGGPGTPFYGQVIRAHSTFQLAEQPYDPGHGATVSISLADLDALHHELSLRRGEMGSRVWGPAVWVPDIEAVPWGARVLTIADPFGNHLRFLEPNDPLARKGLPRWIG
ncbi:glyoxalase [Rhizocola hellebori]|uniref:Bleomycin resistance protein n=1 Tax=Rhizocola hellebori TaxID=1392758 RepID=A0A8J3VJ11_9ACTN|nr:glyoxalase superfamily protein [Rhizocola hellebori]GIH07616.1 glyoxalase [Rhizocola hellebori]